jgi:CRISPR/Cas system CSM-associated protein Csm2 small subunit
VVAEGKDADEQKRRFGYFVDLFEAILAYHTEAGGK